METNSRFYWSSVYGKRDKRYEPSLFARYCVDQGIIQPADEVLELGHGDGRDAFFFSEEVGANVLGYDQSGAIVSEDLISLHQHDFVNLPAEERQWLEDDHPFDHVYSRFSWHSISEHDENVVLELVTKILHPGGSLLIECRTVHDELYKTGARKGTRTREYETGHSRRFIDPGRLLNKLMEENFSIKYAETNTGFAPHEDEDPIVLRIHAVFEGQS